MIALVVGVIFMVLSWLQPMHMMPWTSWHSETLAFWGIYSLAMSLLLHFRRYGKQSIEIPTAAWFLMVLMLIAIVQWVTGLIVFFGNLVVIFVYSATGIVALLVGFNFGREFKGEKQDGVSLEKIVHYFAAAIIIGAALSIVIALIQAFQVWGDVSWINRASTNRRPGGNLGQPNHLATLIGMGVASLLYLFGDKKIGKYATGLLAFLFLVGLAITESRSGLVGLGLLIGWYCSKNVSISKVTKALLVGTVCLEVFIFLSWPKIFTYIDSGGLEGLLSDANVNFSTAGRFMVWDQLLHAVRSRPWFGWGIGEVGAANNFVLSTYEHGLPITFSHNIGLDLLVGAGGPVFLMFSIILWFYFRRILRSKWSSMAWFASALVIPVGVHSMFEFPFAYSYFLLPVLLALGFLESQMTDESRMGLKLHYAAWGGAFLMLIVLCGNVEYIKLEEDYRVARFEALKIGKTPEEYARPNIYLLTQLEALAEVSRVKPKPGMSEKEIELLRRAAMHYPWFAVQNRYAISLALNGDREEAVRQLKVMRAMHGEKAFSGIRSYWQQQILTTYPFLRELDIP